MKQRVDSVYISTALNNMPLPQCVLFELFASVTAATAFFADLHASGQIGCFICPRKHSVEKAIDGEQFKIM